MKQVVNIHEAKTKLSALIAAVEAGHEVVIARGNVPVAALVPYSPPALGRVPGALRADPAWAQWRYGPAVFAPMSDAEADAEGWP